MGTDKRIRCDAELHRQGVGSLEADAVDVQRQAVRIFRDLDDGVKWGADPLDHPGTEILLDTFEGAGGHDFELIGFELEAVRAVVVPDADALDILTGGDGGSRADNSNQLPLALSLFLSRTTLACFFNLATAIGSKLASTASFSVVVA